MKHTIRQVFRSGKFRVGFVILSALLLTTFFIRFSYDMIH